MRSKSLKVLCFVYQDFFKQNGQFGVATRVDSALTGDQHCAGMALAIDRSVVQRRESVGIRKVGQRGILTEKPVNQPKLTGGTGQMNRRLAVLVECFRIRPGLDQALGQAGAAVEYGQV